MPDIVLEAVGVAGVAIYLGSYALLNAGRIDSSGYAYALMNMIAACLVLVSLSVSFNLSSTLIQISWILISLYGIGRRWRAASTAGPGRSATSPPSRRLTAPGG